MKRETYLELRKKNDIISICYHYWNNSNKTKLGLNDFKFLFSSFYQMNRGVVEYFLDKKDREFNIIKLIDTKKNAILNFQ